MTESTDPYVYPGTDVLKNLRDIRDPDILARFEAEATSRRIVQLVNSPLPGRFGSPGDAECEGRRIAGANWSPPNNERVGSRSENINLIPKRIGRRYGTG
jgi:hypothetical protein